MSLKEGPPMETAYLEKNRGPFGCTLLLRIHNDKISLTYKSLTFRESGYPFRYEWLAEMRGKIFIPHATEELMEIYEKHVFRTRDL